MLLALAAILLTGACSSLSKPDLAERLLGLEKNQAAGPLQHKSFVADLGSGAQEFKLIYAHSKAKSPGAGLPIVLVHGTPSTLYSWTELIHGSLGDAGGVRFEGLSATRDVYAIEVIGHGMAPGELSPHGFESCARFVAAAIRALELERVHLVGSSYGGEFAWRAALNKPELMASLVLLDSSGIRRREGDWLSEEVLMRENSLAKFGWLLNSRDRIRSALAPHFREIPPDRVEEFFLVCENSENWRAMVDLARDENGEREGELVDLQTPTLLLWGAEDIAYPPAFYGERFAELIPNSTLVELAGTGHYPHEEKPSAVAKQLVQFFGGVEESK